MSIKVQSGQLKESRRSRFSIWRPPIVWICLILVAASVALSMRNSRVSRTRGTGDTHIVQRGDLMVTVTEQGILESSSNTEIRCQVRGHSVITWVIESGSYVKPGDELVHLDTLAIEDTIAEATKDAHGSRSSAERSAADMIRSQLALYEYLEGLYPTQVMTLEKDLAIAQSDELTAANLLAHAETMAARGYVSGLDVQERTFDRTRAELTVDVTKKQMEVLAQYTKAMQLETLKGNLNEAKARHAADVERARMDAIRRDQAIVELGHCVVTAEKSGMILYPRAERWKRAPEIEEGATLHMNQTMLLMPNLDRMQVKIGLHESLIDRIKPGLAARIKLPDKTLDGEVTAVAEVTAPAGWWTGTAVKYDTVIELASVEGLKPGMSANVEVIIELHENVVTLPVTAVLETRDGTFCWVKTGKSMHERRTLELGDTDEASVVVEAGVQAGEEVWLDPLATIAEAQTLALTPFDKTTYQAALNREVDHVE